MAESFGRRRLHHIPPQQQPQQQKAPSRLQRRAPASLQINRSTEWNVAIPLLSPLVSSPPINLTADRDLYLQAASSSSSSSGGGAEQQKPAAAAAAFKKWQHPAAPFCYDSSAAAAAPPSQFAPFVRVDGFARSS